MFSSTTPPAVNGISAELMLEEAGLFLADGREQGQLSLAGGINENNSKRFFMAA